MTIPQRERNIETWMHDNANEEKLDIWEREDISDKKVVELWLRRMNHEVPNLFGHAELSRIIRSKRLGWLEHYQRFLEKK